MVISALGATVVAGALGFELAGRRGQFTAAIHAAPMWILSLVVLLQLVSLIARNWLVLHGIGVHVSLFDAIAVLIATFTLGQLPIGPSLGPAAAVLILGSHGVATVAAAGVLLTATATVGSLCYAAWALADHFGSRRPALSVEPIESPEPAVTAIPA